MDNKIKQILFKPKYEVLDYLLSTGTQFINTGIYPTEKTKTEIEFGGTSFNTILGTYKSSERYCVSNNNAEFSRMNCSFGNTDVLETTYPPLRDLTKLVIDNGIFTYGNNTIATFSSQTFTCSYAMYLFCLNREGTATFYNTNNLKISYCKIWENGTLIRNLVPTIRLSDLAIGMYDKVNKVFMPNSGSGVFTYGARTGEKIYG